MSAVIHIDSLALPGLTEAEAKRAADSFTSVLEDLLSRHGLPPGLNPRDVAKVDLGALPNFARSPEAMGRALARALFERVWT
jgi:hypothetical protein